MKKEKENIKPLSSFQSMQKDFKKMSVAEQNELALEWMKNPEDNDIWLRFCNAYSRFCWQQVLYLNSGKSMWIPKNCQNDAYHEALLGIKDAIYKWEPERAYNKEKGTTMAFMSHARNYILKRLIKYAEEYHGITLAAALKSGLPKKISIYATSADNEDCSFVDILEDDNVILPGNLDIDKIAMRIERDREKIDALLAEAKKYVKTDFKKYINLKNEYQKEKAKFEKRMCEKYDLKFAQNKQELKKMSKKAKPDKPAPKKVEAHVANTADHKEKRAKEIVRPKLNADGSLKEKQSQIYTILTLHKEGLTQEQIMEKTGLDKSCVSFSIKHYQIGPAKTKAAAPKAESKKVEQAPVEHHVSHAKHEHAEEQTAKAAAHKKD